MFYNLGGFLLYDFEAKEFYNYLRNIKILAVLGKSDFCLKLFLLLSAFIV